SLLSEKGEIRRYVAESAAEIQAARLMTLDAARAMDGGSEARVEIALIKFWGARMLHNVIDRAIQVHGALGVTADTPLEFMYREARYARIYDGPDAVHRMGGGRRPPREPHGPAPGAAATARRRPRDGVGPVRESARGRRVGARVEERRRHLRAAGVLDAREQHGLGRHAPQSSRGSLSMCRIERPFTMKITISAMLVAWSPTRSRYLETKRSRMARLTVAGFSTM